MVTESTRNVHIKEVLAYLWTRKRDTVRAVFDTAYRNREIERLYASFSREYRQEEVLV